MEQTIYNVAFENISTGKKEFVDIRTMNENQILSFASQLNLHQAFYWLVIALKELAKINGVKE